jgi:hypothetical protein
VAARAVEVKPRGASPNRARYFRGELPRQQADGQVFDVPRR